MKENMDTYNKLLNSAMELFQKKGYNATGMNEIVKHSGAPKGCLYYYFPGGKEELAIKVIQSFERTNYEKNRQILSRETDLAKAFESIFEEAIELLTLEGKFKLSITLLSLESIEISEPLRQACVSAFDSLKNIFTERLVQGGFDDASAKERAMILLCLLNGAITLSISQKNISPLFSAKKQVRNILFCEDCPEIQS